MADIVLLKKNQIIDPDTNRIRSELVPLVVDNEAIVQELIALALGAVRPEEFGAVGNGIANDTQAILDAVTACWDKVKARWPVGQRGGKSVTLLITGFYRITATVQFIDPETGAQARIKGIGSEACGFYCASQTAQVRIGPLPTDNHGTGNVGVCNEWGGFHVRGMQVADVPLWIGHGRAAHFYDIDVVTGKIDDIQIVGLQNSTFTAVKAAHRRYTADSGGALVIDAGAANLWFFGCSFTRGSKYNIHIKQTIPGAHSGRRRPSKITFFGGMSESHSSAAAHQIANVILDDSEQVSFYDWAFNNSSATPKFPCLLLRSDNGGPDEPPEEPEEPWYTSGRSSYHYVSHCQWHNGSAAIHIADVGTRPKSITVGSGNLFRTNLTTVYQIDAPNASVIEDALIDAPGIATGATTYFATSTGQVAHQRIRSVSTTLLGPRVTRVEFPASSRTLSLPDLGVDLESTSSNPTTVTVPANVFGDGHVLTVRQAGSGQIQFVAGTGLTLRAPNGTRTSRQWSTASLTFRSPTEAVLSGDVMP
jgi:hypothetical protein